MLSKIYSVSINGLEGNLVEVEVDITNGMPSFNIVGLGDTAIQESRERVRASIKNSQYNFPQTRITVNLAPADIRKKGPSFDLPIAIGILGSKFNYLDEFISKSLFIGELALNGDLRSINSILPSVIFAKENNFKYVFLPKQNFKEASLIPGVKIIPISNLKDIINILIGEKEHQLFEESFDYKNIGENISFENNFDSIVGQDYSKRALLITASGGHNILLEGTPGSGKTMLAKALPSILPKMELQEIIETSKIYSVAGLLGENKPLILTRPFRKIHHTASAISIIGGGRDSRPGEISLAHRGVLFLDEFLEFETKLIETLRQPMEDGEIVINRVNASYKYPSKFIFVGALNPCPCGYLNDKEIECKCSPYSIERYRKKLSGPLLDRIDLYISVGKVEIDELSCTKNNKITDNYKNIVNRAREIQLKRFAGTNKNFNSELSNKEILKFCKLDEKTNLFYKDASKKLNLSARVYFRILKVARTIADINGEQNILKEHLLEALGYRGKQ